MELFDQHSVPLLEDMLQEGTCQSVASFLLSQAPLLHALHMVDTQKKLQQSLETFLQVKLGLGLFH